MCQGACTKLDVIGGLEVRVQFDRGWESAIGALHKRSAVGWRLPSSGGRVWDRVGPKKDRGYAKGGRRARDGKARARDSTRRVQSRQMDEKNLAGDAVIHYFVQIVPA
jgi:hypothetical protein